MIHQRFEFTEGTSNKFWQICYPTPGDDEDFAISWWGSIGTKGSYQMHPCSSSTAARQVAKKKRQEKIAKGYDEVDPQEMPMLVEIRKTIDTIIPVAERTDQQQELFAPTRAFRIET